MTKKIEIRFHQQPNGKEPVRDWLLSQPKTHKRVIGADLKTVEYGWPIGMPVCRPMGKGLLEVRSNLPDKTISRVFFCIEGGSMILLHGIIKKTQKTPQSDLEIARKRMREVVKNG